MGDGENVIKGKMGLNNYTCFDVNLVGIKVLRIFRLFIMIFSKYKGGIKMGIEIASVKDIALGNMMGVEKNGKALLIANLNGTYYAIGDICTHMGCNLSDGTLTGDKVQCQCHGSVFNVKTGAVEKGPAREPEPTYTLKVEGDKITVDL